MEQYKQTALEQGALGQSELTAIHSSLHEDRLPDDTFNPCNNVHVYTWRGDKCVLVITEFSTPGAYIRRIDGWLVTDKETLQTIWGGRYHRENIARILEAVKLGIKPQ